LASVGAALSLAQTPQETMPPPGFFMSSRDVWLSLPLERWCASFPAMSARLESPPSSMQNRAFYPHEGDAWRLLDVKVL
jgi:hypothetical protein